MGKKKKEELNIFVMMLCIVGIVLTVLGALLLKNSNFKMMVIGTEGTVIGLQTSTNSKGEIERIVANLSYKANKSDYKASLNTTDTKLNIGDKMTLYYDFMQPEAVSLTRYGYQGYVAVILGLILVLKTGPRFYRIMRDNYL